MSCENIIHYMVFICCGIFCSQRASTSLANHEFQTSQDQFVNEEKITVYNSHSVSISNIEKHVHFSKIIQRCQTTTSDCFKIAKQPIKFRKTSSNTRHLYFNVTSSPTYALLHVSKMLKILNRKNQFPFLSNCF